MSAEYGGLRQETGIAWTNKSVLSFAGALNPIVEIKRAARNIVFDAREAGWAGPPFNPVFIAKMMNIPIEANASIADARTIISGDGALIEYNPKQARERVRFSIAHELAHLLFPDASEHVRNRGGTPHISDDWQLELLCNLAASEFVMPMGSLPTNVCVPSIEELMVERRKFDVSAEAFLIFAREGNLSIHMPRIGTGAAGGTWEAIVEIIDECLVAEGFIVTVYDVPPRRQQLKLFD